MTSTIVTKSKTRLNDCAPDIDRLNEIGEPQLRAVAASCMGFFLKGQRTYTKDLGHPPLVW